MSSFWKNRNVFITGCTGLLGSYLTDALVKKGANVTGLIRDSVHNSNLRLMGVDRKINILRGEIEDYPLLERALNEYEIDTVFHLAAQTIVGIANRNALSTFETNIRGTWNLLEACRRNKNIIKRIIVASSDKAYGDCKELPYKEDTPLVGTHPYDVSKSCADLICRAYYVTYGMPVCITRCGNLYGGGDLNFNRLIPGTIRSVLNSERPIIRSDGKYIRDYFYVLDAVDAYILLAEKMENNNLCGEAFNFSNEIQIPVINLVEKILKLMDKKKLEPTVLNQGQGEIIHQYLSAEKARKVLGWKPKYTLDKGLSTTIEWYKDFFQIGRVH